jgi:peptide/nickel transport system permease protein
MSKLPRKRTLIIKLTKHIMVFIASVILLLFVMVALFPTWFTPYNPQEQALTYRLQPPGFVSEEGRLYSFGTDHLGRDIYTRIIYGARVSLFVGLAASLSAAVFGVLGGLFSGYFGGLIDILIMRFAEVQLAFPTFLLAITLVSVLGPSLPVVIGVIALGNWVAYGRVVRSEVLALKGRQFILAARAIGLPSSRIIFLHILPNSIPTIIVLVTFNIAFAIILEAALSFVGLGIPAQLSSWGSMLSSGRQYVSTAWWLATLPGLSIFLVVLAINIFGDYLRESTDPYMKVRES